MIDLITGLPGNCKTLYTIAWVRDWAKNDNRAVFYSGIPLSEQGKEVLGWHEIEPDKWFEAPPNSIVIIDEAQRIFRNRTVGTIPGKHVTELETHRHLGIDLVFITQHPSLIDPSVRRLAGRHRHMVRIWGMEASTVHEWSAVRDNCDKPVARKDSEKQKWKFDKSIYPLYKSAEVHTVKRSIPMRVKLLIFVPLAIGAAVYAVGRLVVKKPPEAAKSGQMVSGQVGQAPGGVAAPVFDPVADAKRYVWNQTPRVAGVDYTAPKYDELTKPERVPVPAMCIETKTRCQCYSQQGTVLPATPIKVCIDVARNGYFEEFNPNGREVAMRDPDKAARSAAVLDREDGRLPLSHADTRTRVLSLGTDGYGPLGKAGPGVRDWQTAPVQAVEPVQEPQRRRVLTGFAPA